MMSLMLGLFGLKELLILMNGNYHKWVELLLPEEQLLLQLAHFYLLLKENIVRGLIV
jgi:hypothetical protein